MGNSFDAILVLPEPLGPTNTIIPSLLLDNVSGILL
jgi:hypothetical protein